LEVALKGYFIGQLTLASDVQVVLLKCRF